MGDLWERLRAAQSRVGEMKEPPPTPTEEPAPQGWTWVSPLVAERRLQFALESRFWRAVEPAVDPSAWGGLLCLDTETTGLSGGAGTVAFLVGWAQLVPPSLPESTPEVLVRQWFLRDHPGEPSLLDALDAALQDARGLVSFNGASFDLPLLRSRWALAGKTFPPRPHRDDLHPSRRLWKRLLENCRLSQIEASILGIRRLDDVPGALVPALWFDYLRNGAASDFVTPLEGVLRHHAQDVYSLLCLDLLLAAMRSQPTEPRWEPSFSAPPSRTPLARLAAGGLLHPDLPTVVAVDFWGWLPLLDPPTRQLRLEAAWLETKQEAVGMAWADDLKRQRDGRASEVWQELWRDRRSYPALEELLKWLEHRDRSAPARAQALALIAEATETPFLPQAWRERLEKRRQRLDRPRSSAPP